MRRALAFALLSVAGCQSGIALDPEGQYRCTPENATARTQGGCPPGLFCAKGGSCQRADAGGDYECFGDFGCGGAFRCGPQGRCVDPSADALRADANVAVLSVTATIGAKAPWTQVSAIGAGRTFLGRSVNGQPIDITPIAIADGKDVYTVAVSTEGFTPSERLYLGKATLVDAVVDVAPTRQKVYAISATRLYRYSWAVELDGGVSEIVTAPSSPRIGERLRVGNSAFPIVAEFNLDNREYRLHDSLNNRDTGPVPLLAGPAGATIDDIVDTDGKYLYGAFNGVLYVADRVDTLDAIFNANNVAWTIVGLVSPGRNEQLVDCGGAPARDRLSVRSIHVGDNPDLNQVERPLVALAVDVTLPDGGAQPPHWMRVDPDPQSGTCSGIPKHIARGLCPACNLGDQLKGLQWGQPQGQQPVLRSECAGADGGVTFYDLATDATGFVCQREQRPGGGVPGVVTARQRASAVVDAAAVGTRIYFRRDGQRPFTPLTLDHAPVAIEQVGAGRVALGRSAVFHEVPALGLALADFHERDEAFPVAVAAHSPWILYDDGHVADVEQLGRGGVETLAAPSRDDLKPPFAGARAIASDDRPFLVMSSFDAILAADLSAPTFVAPLEVRVVPEAQVPIVSVVALPPVPGAKGPLVSGYVLTENRLFTLTASTDVLWETKPVAVPEGEWTKLFVDGRRARIGYLDGSVVSLPSGVRIVPPFEPEADAIDYTQYCGGAYALTQGGLFALKYGSPEGHWEAVALPALAGGGWERLYESRAGELWVLANDGRAVALKGVPCAP